jgi:elongator complex protein 3
VIKRQLSAEGRACRCIRCREVRGESVRALESIGAIEYETSGGRELFLNMNTDTGKLAGFLRLSLPTAEATTLTGIGELRGAAIIREVHVYGPVVELGRSGAGGPAQHSGLGAKLLREAVERARAAGYDRLAVISAIGTRHYYLKHGFQRGELYLIKALK